MKKPLITASILFLLFAGVYLFLPSFLSGKHEIGLIKGVQKVSIAAPAAALPEVSVTPVAHIPTPKVVKALYMSSWVAGTPSFRDKVLDIVNTSEVNALVIDVKDSTGKMTYKSDDSFLAGIGSGENRVRDIKALIEDLHKKHIYVIGRIAVFQDPYFVAKYPDLAVKRKSDGGVWKDKKGVSWLDAGSKDVWDYVIAIARDAYDKGFDEVNFDYIRFPSDGNMTDIYFPKSDGKAKPEVLREFFTYLNANLKSSHGDIQKDEITMSVDLFGLTTTAKDDLGIGQVIENAFPYFDYIDPMVYPSHYPPGFEGYKNPADHPYEVITIAMDGGVLKAKNASTTPLKLRPWLQDFDLGATYTKDMVRAQIKATYDVGLTSWLMWDAGNTYTKEAFLPEN